MKRALGFFSLILFLSITVNNLYAQEEKYIGLFVYNFTKYFDWPESTKTNDFVIQVLGHTSVYEELVKIASDKKVGAQDLVIKKVATPEDINTCQMIFIGHWQSRHLPVIIDKVGLNPTLIITEMEGLLDSGSVINFVIRDGKIKFEMNASNATKQQLKIDLRIRELAYKVID